MPRLQSFLLAMSLGAAPFSFVGAQQYTYTTSTVTSCGPTGAGGASGASPTLLGPGSLLVPMPPCPACDCNTCVHSNIYTATFGAFCPHGTTAMAYTITEVYSGMSAAPTLADRPHCPPGFTTGVETCTVCGDKPVTATMTYPIGGSPYIPGMAVPTPTGSAGNGNSGGGNSGAGSPGSPASPTPEAPAGANNGSIPYNGPTAGASYPQGASTWALVMASALLLTMFGL